MALEIKATPKLNNEKSINFLQRVAREQSITTTRKDTSKISEAKKVAFKHAVLGPK